MAHSDAATVHCVRSVLTDCVEACARSLPERVARRAVWIWGVRFDWRKAVRRLVRRRGGVGADTDIGDIEKKREKGRGRSWLVEFSSEVG